MKTLLLLLLTVATAQAGWLHHCMHDARQVCIQAHATVDEPTTTTTTTLPCHFDVLPYEGENTQPDYCGATPSYCVVVNGCGYVDAVYCPQTEVMDQCAYRATCHALYPDQCSLFP